MQIVNGHDLNAKELFSLIREIYQSTNYYATSFEEAYPAQSDLANFLKDLKVRPGSQFLIARNETELLGYLMIEPRKQLKLLHTADLNMGIRDVGRGKGIGKKLLQEALSNASQKKVLEIIYLMVREDNIPAVNLYDSVGFERVVTLDYDTKIDGRYYNGIMMRKFLGEIGQK